MVTAVPGIALGVLAADCAPVLFADPEARVIGAAHGGWRGALAGVMEATVAAMTRLGARAERIRAGIGPCIAQPSYEVGPEFHGTFVAPTPAKRALLPRRRRVPAISCSICPAISLTACRGSASPRSSAAPHDTAAEEELFFSYRRACLRGESDYGRGLAAIALAP